MGIFGVERPGEIGDILPRRGKSEMSKIREKMKGVFAELKTYSKETGKVVNTELVFRPFCDWARTDFNKNRVKVK